MKYITPKDLYRIVPPETLNNIYLLTGTAFSNLDELLSSNEYLAIQLIASKLSNRYDLSKEFSQYYTSTNTPSFGQLSCL